MLDHFHVQHHVELLSGFGEGFSAGMTIIYCQPRLRGMDLRDRDIARRRIRADNLRPKPCHRLAQQAPATADIQNAQARKGTILPQIPAELCGDLSRDVIQTAWVEHVKRLELALRIPPFGGHCLEFGDLLGIYRGLTGLHSALHVLNCHNHPI
jgi:hypothetical protein